MQYRKPFLPEPEYLDPTSFHHTNDFKSSPTKEDYKPKTVEVPTFEVMGSRRRTDTSYVKMKTQ